MVRKYTNKILDGVSDGSLDSVHVLTDLLNWISEQEVQEFAEHYGYDEYDEDLDDDDDHVKEVYGYDDDDDVKSYHNDDDDDY